MGAVQRLIRQTLQLNVAGDAVTEVAGLPAVPSHFNQAVDLDDGAELFGVFAGYSLANVPCGAVGGRDSFGHGRLSPFESVSNGPASQFNRKRRNKASSSPARSGPRLRARCPSVALRARGDQDASLRVGKRGHPTTNPNYHRATTVEKRRTAAPARRRVTAFK